MSKIIFILIALFFLRIASVQACTSEEFKALDHDIAENQAKYRAEKLTQFDNYLQQIQIKKNFSDKDLFLYRTNVLNNQKLKKLHEKERSLSLGDYFNISRDGDCKKLKKWTDESMESANKQWNIVFEEIEQELK